jgi:uncharacterized membrane protein YiaA
MKDVIDTVTRVKQQRQAEARKMINECTIICVTIIVLTVTIIFVGLRIG